MNDHIAQIPSVLDMAHIVMVEKDREYGASWKSRGGVGAFMMMARKWDRLQEALRPADGAPTRSNGLENVAPWDILEALRQDQRSEGIIDDIRDLRNYLCLIEAEHLAGIAATITQDTETEAMDSMLSSVRVESKYPKLLDKSQEHILSQPVEQGSMAGAPVSYLYREYDMNGNTHTMLGKFRKEYT